MRLLHPRLRHERNGVARQQSPPKPEEIKHGCAGNLCRCGTHPHIVSAILQAAGIDQQNKTMVVNYVDLADEQ